MMLHIIILKTLNRLIQNGDFSHQKVLTFQNHQNQQCQETYRHFLLISSYIYRLFVQFIGQLAYSIIMNLKNKGSESRPQPVFPISSKREAKGSSPIRDSLQQNSTFLADNLINFDINSYPFLNQLSKTPRVFRSTVNLKASSQQLRKIMRLNHPNLINVQKITRGHGKQASLNKQHDIYYSFYYDQVPFSLKYVAMYQDNSNTILKKINQTNLQKILTSLSEYLQRTGINYLFSLGDIGVTKEGDIKVFFSPIHLSADKEMNDKNQIATSINKITAWWETTLASNTSLNPKSSNIILPSEIGLEDEASIDYLMKDHQESFIDKQTSQLMGEEYDQSREYNQYRNSNAKESMVKNSTLKYSNNSLKSDLSRLSTSQMNKMKKIDQQIKYIRERLKDKRKQHKESDSFLDKKEKDKFRREGNIMAQSDKIQKKDNKQDKSKAQGSKVIEKIQQNINCINIYTQAKDGAQNVSHTKIKKMTSQPIYSFQIAPENAKQRSKPQKVIIHHPSFEPEDFPNSEGASSVDTYQMELQTEIEPAKAVQRNSALICQREISEKNYRPSHQNQLMSEKKNQVANKHVTQSAGPLQFKNFVNKYIKPQFLAKKSNIYEDPMEYESETSKSISKKKKIIADLYQNGKSVNSQTQKSSSLNHNPQEVDCKKKDLFQQAQCNQDAFLKGGYNRTNSEIKLLPIRDNSAEKNEQQANSKRPNDSKIGQRIKLVLEKTKNAIALLNRVKNCKSPPVSEQKIHSSSHNY